MNPFYDGPIEIGLTDDIRRNLESNGYICMDNGSYYTSFNVYHNGIQICLIRLNIDNESLKHSKHIQRGVGICDLNVAEVHLSINSPNLVQEILQEVKICHKRIRILTDL